jgi:hypothetical protein
VNTAALVDAIAELSAAATNRSAGAGRQPGDNAAALRGSPHTCARAPREH